MLIIKKDVLVLVKGSSQGLDDNTITAEAKHPINFTRSGRRFLLRLHYNGSNNVLFVCTVKLYPFKARDSEIKPYSLCSANII